MSATRHFLIAEAIPEKSTYVYRATITDDEDEPVAINDVTNIFATLRDVTSDTIVNGRSAQEVKNANGGTLTEGLFTLQFEEDDTSIVGSGTSEQRELTLDFRLAGGGRVTRLVTFYVRNFSDI